MQMKVHHISSRPSNPVVLVTGTSSGIGLALARTLSRRRDLRSVITARAASLPKLEAEGFHESEGFRIRALDVNQPEERVQLIEEIDAEWGGVDVLINNAGIAYRAVIEHMSPLEAIHQLATNFLGPMELTRLVLPQMRAKRWGRILNISSVSGMMAMPSMGSYSASKFALEGASESLWYEVRPWNIHVTLVQPGFIRSNSFKNIYLAKKAREEIESGEGAYNLIYERMAPFVEALMNRSRTTPDTIARRILATLDHPAPPLRLSGTLDARFFYVLRRLLPRGLYHELLYRSLPGVRSWGPEDP